MSSITTFDKYLKESISADMAKKDHMYSILLGQVAATNVEIEEAERHVNSSCYSQVVEVPPELLVPSPDAYEYRISLYPSITFQMTLGIKPEEQPMIKDQVNCSSCQEPFPYEPHPSGMCYGCRTCV